MYKIIKKIILTGDDGYQSPGIRLLVSLLKDSYMLKIAATQEQRSAVGGGVTHGGIWGMDDISGVEALWVSGTPADAVEAAESAFDQKFDLVISGVNQGANVGCCNASGTVGAAVRCLSRGTSPKAIALSWNLPPSSWFENRDTEDISHLLDYPGNTILKLLDLIINNHFWNAEFLNINLPAEPTSKVRFCQPMPREMTAYYNFDIFLEKSTQTYTREIFDRHQPPKDLILDASALEAGFITITPWLSNLYLNQELLALIGKEIEI